MSSQNNQSVFIVLFDGKCPFCVREVNWLKKRNKNQLLDFEDITHQDFDPQKYGRTHDDLMARIHGVKSDGSIVVGVEVFREAYSRIGLRWLVVPTSWPVFRTLFDCLYMFFARNRMKFGKIFGRNCESGSCSIESK